MEWPSTVPGLKCQEETNLYENGILESINQLEAEPTWGESIHLTEDNVSVKITPNITGWGSPKCSRLQGRTGTLCSQDFG